MLYVAAYQVRAYVSVYMRVFVRGWGVFTRPCIMSHYVAAYQVTQISAYSLSFPYSAPYLVYQANLAAFMVGKSVPGALIDKFTDVEQIPGGKLCKHHEITSDKIRFVLIRLD